MKKELENIIELKDFLNENNINYEKGLILVDRCNIKYEFKSRQGEIEVIEGYAKLQIDSSNMNFGIIQIIGNDFPSRMVHTNFNPRYVKFMFNPITKSLEINGIASGNNIIDGRYKVTLFLY